MKIKVYRVIPKENPNGVFYMVAAPNKRIAKWCGANLFNNEYIAFLSAKDMVAERFMAENDILRKTIIEMCKNLFVKGGAE
jgi:hypothetical protein